MAPKILFATTVPISLNSFTVPEIKSLMDKGFEVAMVSSPGPELEEAGQRTGAKTFGISITRDIAPFDDLFSILRLWVLFVKIRPDVLIVSTAKASTLGLLVGMLARIPIRYYMVRGLMSEIRSGWRSNLLSVCEWFNCHLAHLVNPISNSAADFLISHNLCPAQKLKVYGCGSGEGIDAMNSFNPRLLKEDIFLETRKITTLSDEDIVIGFCGRIAKAKGIRELLKAWETLKRKFPKIRLLVVGEVDATDPIDVSEARVLHNDPRIVLAGFINANQLPYYYRLMDILVLPTYREGFGNVLLEAGAMEVPVVASRVTGCVDSVVEGVTGTLVQARDFEALERAIEYYIDNPALRIQHGKAARERALKDFNRTDLLEARYRDYVRLLNNKGIPLPQVPRNEQI